MPRYSMNKTAACARSTASLLGRNQADLTAKGFDATGVITALNDGADSLPVTDVTQEDAKSQQVDATATVLADTHTAYLVASGALTTATGLLGKNSSAADEARRIRNECAVLSNPAQVAAFGTSVVAFLNTHTAALVAKKWNPASKITDIAALAAVLTGEKGVQEGKKGARGNASTAVETATDALFTLANDTLESVLGLYPGENEVAKEVRRIRAALRGRDPRPPATPTPPSPTPPAP
ncbi:MAG: hypothetical protein HY301_10480 [Verrucomicrobia bacterium]|nr:hypothetical protein [Verrucomicrobiota bacterium]